MATLSFSQTDSQLNIEGEEKSQHDSSRENGFLTFSFGFSLPSGDFDEYGGAATGLDIGLRYVYPLNNKGLSLCLGADFIHNGLTSEIKDNLASDYYSVTPSRYINIPVIAGLDYTHKADEDVTVFMSLGIGPDFFKITDMTKNYSNGGTNVYSFNLSTQFAYKLGGGFIVKDKYLISLFYNSLGDHLMESESSMSGSTSSDNINVHLFTLTAGIIL